MPQETPKEIGTDMPEEFPADRRADSAPERPGSAENARPSGAPDFALSHPEFSVRTQGTAKLLDGPESAREALRDGSAEMVVGAIPFDATGKWALSVPEKVVSSSSPLEPPSFYRSGEFPSFTLASQVPSPRVHRERVARAVSVLNSGELDKVVLARRELFRADRSFDSRAVAARLMSANPSGYGFLTDLSAAGPEYSKHYLVGSSPELLVRKMGNIVTSFPLAGSTARRDDSDEDEKAAAHLQASAKDLREHRYVVDHIAEVLGRFSSAVEAPDVPELLSTRELWHLGTPITATVDDPDVTALDLAEALHPTPALGGSPRQSALEYILANEEDRRFYGGAVGWCAANGDGIFMVSIRCGETDETNRSVTAWGGGGIVSDSDPSSELEETKVKLTTIRRSLGL
jgi:isochorismate synthase